MASQWEQIKWIPGTTLMVDGFRYQNAKCKSYLLTHFHSDHTTGLAKSFNAGIIYCTPVTACLLRKDMGMPAERICELPLDRTVVIEGTEVTPIDANHCPGACMFVLRTKSTAHRKSQTILHTGDIRWSNKMAEHPAIRAKQIDMLFLDTTYAKPTHTHPPQDECIALMVKLMKQELTEHPKTVFVVGSYHIGKERAYLGAAKLLGWKVWCDANKRRVLKMLNLPDEDLALLTTKQNQARIHVNFLGGLQPEKLQEKIDSGPWTHAVGFRPTGWTFRRSGKLDIRRDPDHPNVKTYGIPYSEHSSWTELRACVAALRPRRLIPTVNATNPGAARTIVNRFADLMDLSTDRSRLDFFLRKQASGSTADVLHRERSCAREGSYTQSPPEEEEEEEEEEVEETEIKSEEARHGVSAAATDQSRAAIVSLGVAEPPDLEQPLHWTPQHAAAVKLEASNCKQTTEHVQLEASEQPPHTAAAELPPGTAGYSMQDRYPAPGSHSQLTLQGTATTVRWKAEATENFVDRLPSGAALLIASAGVSSVPGFRRGKGAAARALAANLRKKAVSRQPGSDEESASIDAVGDPLRADSHNSTTEHLDIAGIDVTEQERILDAIAQDRKRRKVDLETCLTKKRQATLACFLKKLKQ